MKKNIEDSKLFRTKNVDNQHFTEKQNNTTKKMTKGNTTKKATTKQPNAALKQTVAKEPHVPKMGEKIEKFENFLQWNHDFRFNEVLNYIEVRNKENEKWVQFSEENRTKPALRMELMKKGFTGVKSLLDDVVLNPEFSKPYNPFKHYFVNLPKWDGTDYIQQLCAYIEVAENHQFFEIMLKKHLVRTVACALRVIPFNKHCFVLKGKQHDGKTSFIRALCPPSLLEYYKEDPPLDHKDSNIALSRNLIINLDELHELDKANASKVKALISKASVSERLSHDKFDSKMERYASFYGTINESEFLNDVTGNVRWIVFEILKINWSGENGYVKNLDINKVYAQAYHLLKSGFECELSKEEIDILEQKNREYQKKNIEIELVGKYFEPAEKSHEDALFVTPLDIQYLLTIHHANLKINYVSIGRALTFFGFQQVTKRTIRAGKELPRKGYYVKVNNPALHIQLSNYINNCL